MKAGVIIPPEGCEVAKGTCEIILVKKSDPSQPCIDPVTTTEEPAEPSTEESTETNTEEPTEKTKCHTKPKY